jgi:hypothetical protein
VTYTIKANHGSGKITSGSSYMAYGAKKATVSAPSGISATNSRCDGKVTLSWNYYLANPLNFKVYRSTSAAGTYSEVGSVDGGERSYVDAVPNSNMYYYKIATTGDCGPVTSSNNYPGEAPTTPAKPTAVTAIPNAGNSAIVVNWSDNSSNETGFAIERTIQGASGSTTFLVGPNITTYTDVDVNPCVNYTYVVKSRNNCEPIGNASLTGAPAKIFPVISNSFNGTTNKLRSSKGYFTNMVQLDWSTVNIDVLTQYRIYRKIYGAVSDSILIGTVGSGEGSFIDNNSASGILYKYTLVGVLNCAGTFRYSDVSEDIGFRSASGTVSGQVTYTGGFALRNARVIVAPAGSGSFGSSLNVNSGGSLSVANSSKLTFTNGVTLDAWFKTPSVSGIRELIRLTAASKIITLRLNGSKVELVANNGSVIKTVTSSNSFTINTYNQVSATLASDSLIIYLNGYRDSGITLSGYTIMPINSSNIIMGTSYVGNIDEVRVYSRAKPATSIYEDYNRRVNPDDLGLVAYYTFDENLSSYNGFFDYSKQGVAYNENHGFMTNVSYNSSVPSVSQLAFASYTDSSGAYVVSSVPYTGAGQVFTVTPTFSTHLFDPINRALYIGEGSSVHTQQDFIDKSSFLVTGNVFYDGTSCPAEGIKIKIDGEEVKNGGDPVTTAQNGTFAVQVPIGNHVISVEKEGHVFSAGRFPSGVGTTYNFQNEVSNIQFKDNTLIKVVGRAVGGYIEAVKKPGLGLSINNIGKTRIYFKSQLGNGCSVATINTNDSSGEYTVYLPPLVYTVDTVKVPTNPVLNFGIQQVLDLTNATNVYTSADTSFLPGTNTITNIRSVNYNVRRDFIYYTTPSLSFTRTKSKTATDSSFVGDTKLMTDSVNFIDLFANPFPFPVFTQFKEYTAKVYAFDVYENRDNLPTKVYQVPLNGRLLVNNGLASLESAVQNVEVLDGVCQYIFRGGMPDLTINNANNALSFTRTLQAIFFTTGNNGDRSVNWLPNTGNTPYRAYVFGGKTRGSSYVSSGPSKVDLILRDPPGSASSTTWTKNTTYNSIKRYSTANKSGAGFEGQINLGFKWQTSTGLGVEFETESYVGGSEGLSMSSENTAGKNGELIESLSASVSISTGSGSDQVGSNADVFFGHATNYLIGISDNLTLIPAARCIVPGVICGGTTVNGFKIGVNQSLALNPKGIESVFAYTTGEIEEIVIPQLVKTRNRIVTQSKKTNGQAKYLINFTDTEDEKYELKFASNNDDPIWGNARNKNNSLVYDTVDRTGPSYTFRPDRTFEIDSIRYFNNQIRMWKEALAKNEREKYEAFALNIGNVLNAGTNTSIGKASLTREFTSTRSRETTTSEELFLSETGSLGFNLDVAGSGFEFNGSVTVEETKTNEEGVSTDTSTTISYTLNDGDDGDLISVDIVDPKTGNGHMFKLRGGQTSCPYEGPEWSHYYKPNDITLASTYFEDGEAVKLTDGTAKRHVPKIQIPQPYKFNVPADQPATFVLQLGNESESEDDQEYSLRVVEVTNPNGAVLTIDGLDPNRNFSIPYATNISKTLSIRRGTEYYDYDSILLVFKSPCDDDLSDSVYVSVHFIPTCTEPFVYNPGDKWTLNNSFNDTMGVIINGYDYNFGGFKAVTFQYKPSSSSQWNILQTFRKIPIDILDREIPSAQPYIEYAWNMRQLPDGPYDIRAVTTCSAPGHLDAQVESMVKSGIADRVNPSPFGSPSPADGILSPNDEVQIQFNEPVDNASLSYQNFDIRGVLNGSAHQNTASVYFDGDNDYVEIPTGLNLSKKTFALEFWVRRQTLGEQVVFSQGVDASQYISIGFDAQNKFAFRIGNQVVTTTAGITDTTSFHHYTVSYRFESDMCELFVDGIVANTGNTSIYNKYEGGGKTIIGKLAQSNNKFFRGNLRDFRLWSRIRTSSEILGSINLSLKGTEAGIMANWRLDEADGSIAKDYIRARHATIYNAVWEINPKGKSYRLVNEPLQIAASDIAFTEEKDFTIEFWFKGANIGGNVALFSNGRGDSTDANPSIRWSIEKDASGKIYVKHRGFNFEAVSENYFDGNWHHFALVMQRATSLAAYLDGNQQKSVATSDFKLFGGNKIWIGARGFQPAGLPDVVDRTFNGFVDEVRIWNSARKQEQIIRDRVNRLAGTESDLVFYLPFETYTLNLGVPILTGSVMDMKNNARVITGASASGSGLNAESPKIKLQRPVQSINFTYSLNQDKIILTPTTLPALIENVTLDITTKDVYDLNGNKMQSPKTWIAYVDKNQVKWQDQEFNFTKKRGLPLTFTSNVVNSGGAIKQFDIQNLPSWLSASPSSGTILPNSYRTITFTVDPNVNIGTYENEVQVLTDFGYPDGLLVKLKVYADMPSNWNVNTSLYSNNMSIVGQIRINNVISTNPDNVLAAFVNGECRGVASLQYFPQIDRYFAFLNVYSNVTQGETLEFKIWNAGEGKIHSDVTPQIQFVTNGQIGSIANPEVFNATDKLTRFIPLSPGWNWISFNLNMRDSNDINKLFSGLRSGNGDLVRNQTLFADYSVLNGWAGSLANPMVGVKPEPSYRLRSTNADTLVINGIEIDPSTRPIRLDSGWNWVGYISQRNLSVTEAFSSLNATSGDLVKSQNQFALYDANIGWVGSLTTMIPNKGYMYKSGSNTIFAYPKSAMYGKTGVADNQYISNYFKFNAAKFEKNMSTIIDAGACNEAIGGGILSLGAYVGNELRGVTKVTTLASGKNLYFLTIASNNTEEISFKLLDEKSGKTFDLEGNLMFESNKLVGSITQPLTLKVGPDFNCNQYTTAIASSASLYAYPNPFGTKVMFSVTGINAPKLKVRVIDVAGKVVDVFDYISSGSGTANIDWTPTDRGVTLNQGIYFVEVSANNQVARTKIIKY